MHTLKTGFVIFTLTLALSACGFHLRGSLAFDLPEGVEPIYIGGSDTNSQLHLELRRLLKAYDVQLADNVNDANHQLVILEQNTDRRTASIGAGARAAEIQLLESVSFQILDNQGRKISGPNTVNERRILQNNPNQVASTRSEETLLRREMISNLASKVARQINAVNFQNKKSEQENKTTQAEGA